MNSYLLKSEALVCGKDTLQLCVQFSAHQNDEKVFYKKIFPSGHPLACTTA